MLRLTNVILPIDHPEADLKAAILARLKIAPQDLLSYTIFRRGYDARRKNAITLVYTLDVEVKDEAGVLARLQGTPPTPATSSWRTRLRACRSGRSSSASAPAASSLH